MSGLREVPGKSRVLTHTTECHSPEQTGSRWSRIFSWLQTGKQGNAINSEKNRERGWVRREGRGLCACGGVGGLEKKGRMLRTVAEEVEGISLQVPTVSAEQS